MDTWPSLREKDVPHDRLYHQKDINEEHMLLMSDSERVYLENLFY